jgi:hypothetical protein
MFSFRYLQSPLIFIAMQICVCSGAQAAETLSRAQQADLKETVKEVSRPDNAVAVHAPVHKRTAHWKTRYWNQKPQHKTH